MTPAAAQAVFLEALAGKNVSCENPIYTRFLTYPIIPLPSLNLSSVLTTDLIRNLAKLLPTLGLAAIFISMCANPFLSVTPTPTPDFQATQIACMAQTMVAGAQTAMAVTPTPIPSATPTPFQFPADKVFTANNQIFTCNDVALYFGVTLDALMTVNPGLNCNAVNIGVTQFNIPPLTLKSPNEYVSQYNCVPSAGKTCLSPNASAEEIYSDLPPVSVPLTKLVQPVETGHRSQLVLGDDTPVRCVA